MPSAAKDPADYILPLYMNGLQGRMLRMPARGRRKREILFIYGHHTSLERYFGVAEFLNRYGTVTIPDLPGFGGMEPFNKIGEKPTLDNMADYLASFIKLRYKNKKFVLTGYSLGVMIFTRMLQKHPEIAKKVEMVISVGGFAHKYDFKFKRRNYWLMRLTASFFTYLLPAAFVRYVIFRGPFIRFAYKIVEKNHPKFTDAEEVERKRRIDFEVNLWQINDVRTYMSMAVAMLTLDLTKQRIDLPIYHVGMKQDWYFNNITVEQHMRAIYNDFIYFEAKSLAHSPTVIATVNDAAPFIPVKLRRLLAQKSPN
jgi:pimeloyl-ACP methyl ester carboxylesterase